MFQYCCYFLPRYDKYLITIQAYCRGRGRG